MKKHKPPIDSNELRRARRKRHQAGVVKRAKDLLGNKCIFCGPVEKVQAAHVKPTELKGAGRGQFKKARDYLAHPDCYAPMCIRCHRLFDKFLSGYIAAVYPVKVDEIPF